MRHKKTWLMVVLILALITVPLSGVHGLVAADDRGSDNRPWPVSMLEVLIEIKHEIANINVHLAGMVPPDVPPEDDPVVWKGFSTIVYPCADVFARVAHQLEEATDGQFLVETAPGIPLDEVLAAVHSGELDFALWHPMFDWADAGQLIAGHLGVMSPLEHHMWFAYAGGRELVQEEMYNRGYNIVVSSGGGSLTSPEVFLHSRVAIDSPDDLDGLKVRAAGLSGVVFARMGAIPVSMLRGDVYDGLLEDHIDAAEVAHLCFNYGLGLG